MRTVITAIVAAVSAGVIIGLVSRVGMALVAIAAGHSSQFSLAGTAGILFIYSVAMIPGALVAAFTRRPIRWLLPAAGGAFLLVPAIGVASEEIGDVSGLPIGQNILLVLLGMCVFATIPAVVVLTMRLLDRMDADRLGAVGLASGDRQPTHAS